MKHKHYLIAAFIAAASILAPIHASALSVNDFEKQTAQQQTDSYKKLVNSAIADAYQVNNQVGDAVGAYFTTIPKGAVATLGYTAFDANLRDVLQNNKSNPAKLDGIQIEDIIAYVIRTDILPNVAQNTPQPAPKAP